MKVKRMGITEIVRSIWLFSTKKIIRSESVSKQPTQIIIAVEIRHNCKCFGRPEHHHLSTNQNAQLGKVHYDWSNVRKAGAPVRYRFLQNSVHGLILRCKGPFLYYVRT